MTGFRIGLSGCGGGLETGSAASLFELASFAEDLGFDALWINEEHFQGGDDGRFCLSPLILASALAARTSRIRIGFSVLLMALHHPLRLAEELASLDVLSSGRVDIGLSRGASPHYLAAFSALPEDASAASFASRLDTMIRAWRDEPLQENGQRLRIEPKPLQRPHPPVFIGTYTPATAAWAARAGHCIICHGINSLDMQRPVLSAWQEAGGNMADVPFGRFVYVSDSDESARREIWPVICKLTARLESVGIARKGNIITPEELESEAFFRNMVIAGSPQTCAERIAELRDKFGISYLNALPAFFGYLPEDFLKRSLTLLAKEVRPLIEV